MSALDFELRNFRRLKQRGLAALRTGRKGAARMTLLRAAECLYRIAAKSREPFKGQRCRSAGELLSLARSIGEGPLAQAVEGEEGGASAFEMVARPDVDFDSVAGLDEVKEEIRLRMVYPFTHPEIARRYGLRGGGGVLFYGPPGNGKTLLARAVAGEIEAAFFTVRPSDIMSKWVGEAEKNVSALFAEARGRDRAVIFIDEIEALAPVRTGEASSVMTRVVPQLLAELEGVSGRGPGALLFIGATNAPWDLDPAILRPGRFDVKVYVGLPDREARAAILSLELSGRPIEVGFDFDAVAGALSGYSGADLRRLVEKTVGDTFLAEIRGGGAGRVSEDDVLSAASEVRPSVGAEGRLRYREWAQR